jgi:hypothetical protein
MRTIELSPFLKADLHCEAGYEQAMFGLSLNKKQDPDNMPRVSKRLCDKDGGHNKFLEHINTHILVTGPRYWWQEADTYRLSSKQSESTIYTLKKELKHCNTTETIDIWKKQNLECPGICDITDLYNAIQNNEELWVIKGLLPEQFLQTRMWALNYKTLRNIILQRRKHILPHWQMFIRQVLEQVEHPELLPILED